MSIPIGQAKFGLGYLSLIPGGATPTPVTVAILQEIQLDISSAKKLLYGEYQAAILAADAELKITGKAKFGQISGALMQAALPGSTLATGRNEGVEEAGTVASAAVTVAGSATFVYDLGVFKADGTQLTRVASAPAAGVSYSVAAGVYTFNATDNGVAYTFRYVKSAVTGQTITGGNPLTGQSTTYGLSFYNSPAKDGSKSFGFKLNAVVVPKLSFPMKNQDWMIQDVDFEALADSSGNLISEYIG